MFWLKNEELVFFFSQEKENRRNIRIMRPPSTKANKQKNPFVHIVFSEIPELNCNVGLPIVVNKILIKELKFLMELIRTS